MYFLGSFNAQIYQVIPKSKNTSAVLHGLSLQQQKNATLKNVGKMKINAVFGLL